MTLRKGVYIVPTNEWYIERTVWLIAGIVLLASTMMSLLVNRYFILGVIATGLVSISVSLTGFCPVGNVLKRLGFKAMLDIDDAKPCIACRPTSGIWRGASILQWGSIFRWLRFWC
jgi:hypothetical protein